MAPTKTQKNVKQSGQTGQRSSNNTRRRKVVKPTSSLDRNAAQYARLLADPLGAPLVYPVSGTGDSGFLFRADGII